MFFFHARKRLPAVVDTSGSATGYESSTDAGLPIGVTALIGAIAGLGIFFGVFMLVRRRAAATLKTTSRQK